MSRLRLFCVFYKMNMEKIPKGGVIMKVNIISREEMLSNSLLDIRGGLPSVIAKDPQCTCDCIISNTNSVKKDQ